ncbi:MAG: hypothetical protein PF486_09705 [Prolixibacteraceae bacterium]|nr:hypothetical protein [Prolixibacteraceae bacterium]
MKHFDEQIAPTTHKDFRHHVDGILVCTLIPFPVVETTGYNI